MKIVLTALAASLATAVQAGAPIPTPVPEPGAIGLLAFGALAAAYLVRRRK